MIQVNNISKSYKIQAVHCKDISFREMISNIFNIWNKEEKQTFLALKSINFTVKQGESIALLGKNGSGKSTLLKIFSKVVFPSSGNIIMEGKICSLLEAGTGFHAELTGRENVYLNGTILGMKPFEIRDKFLDIIEFAEIGNFIDEPIKRYSSGMILRLAFSVAAHLDPDILIIDEVLAVGDVQFREKCIQKMEELKKQKKILLFVSHDEYLVRRLSDKALFLDKGKQQFFGNIDEGFLLYNASFNKERVGHEL